MHVTPVINLALFAQIRQNKYEIVTLKTFFRERIACLGGIYNNYLALEAALLDARRRGVETIYCLGDLGAFGPYPDRVFPLLDRYNVQCIQGNYDHSIGNHLDDCQCGYTDSRDNHFAQISYDYTLANTSSINCEFMRTLPSEIRLQLGSLRVLLCHGSPRRTNEFLWESTSSDHFLRWLADSYDTDVIVTTHTGIKWYRQISEKQHFINVGVLGRPENNGQTDVWYTILEHQSATSFQVEFIPVQYDFHRLSQEMHNEGLPEEFRATIETGWWTTCLEILPAKERKCGRY